MSLRWWFSPPRHLLALFLAVTIVPATALAWLSWRLLEQDHALATQRLQERLEHTADLIAAELERRLAEIEEELPAWAAAPATDDLDDALIVAFSPHGVEAHPASRLLYHPFVLPATEPPSHVFMAGEIPEFQEQDFPRRLRRHGGPLLAAVVSIVPRPQILDTTQSHACDRELRRGWGCSTTASGLKKRRLGRDAPFFRSMSCMHRNRSDF